MTTEKILEEFEKRLRSKAPKFPYIWQIVQRLAVEKEIEEELAFLSTSITQALAEERERVRGMIEKELKLLSSAYAGLETLPEKSANLAIRDSFIKIIASLSKPLPDKE